MPPTRTFSLAVLDSRSSSNARSEQLETPADNSFSSLRSLFGSSSTKSSSSSASSRKNNKPYSLSNRCRSLPEGVARRSRSMEVSKKGRVVRRGSGRGGGGGGLMRRARTWNFSFRLDPPLLAPAPLLPLLPLPAAPLPPPLARSPVKPAVVESSFNFLASSSNSSGTLDDASTPKPLVVARPPLPPPPPHKPQPSKSKVRLVHVHVPEFAPEEEEEDENELHVPATGRSKTRLRAMLKREKEYREELLAFEGDVGPGRRREAESRCGIELDEFEREAKHLLEIVPHPDVDPALSYHLAICPDSRFLSILLFSRLVSLVVFSAEDEGGSDQTREASIRETSLTCLILACKTNHDFNYPLHPIGIRGLRWLLRKDFRSRPVEYPSLLLLEETTLQTFDYRIHPPTFHALLSEMPSSLSTLQDALDHLAPETWTILEEAAFEDLKTILLNFSHTNWAPSLILCALIWRDLRDVMKDQLSLEEARERAEEVREEMSEMMGFEREEWKEVRIWIREVVDWAG